MRYVAPPLYMISGSLWFVAGIVMSQEAWVLVFVLSILGLIASTFAAKIYTQETAKS